MTMSDTDIDTPDDAGAVVPASDRLFATPAGIALGPVDAILPGAARGYVVQMRAGRFHGFVVRRGDAVFGYVDRCPHAGLPLAHSLDDYLTPRGDLIVCGWHSAMFAIEDGRCVGGPCIGQSLAAWPVEVVNGVLKTCGPPEPHAQDV